MKRLKKEKKAQITVFVLIGLVLLLIITLAIYYKTDIIKKITETEIFEPVMLSSEAESVKKDAQGCITNILEEGLFLLGLQGGYISLEGVKYTELTRVALLYSLPDLKGTAYAYYNNANNIPSEKLVIRSLTSYMNENVPKECKKDIEGVSYGRFNSKITLEDTKVIVTADWPITVKKGDTETKIKELIINIPVRLKILLPTLKRMVDEQMMVSKEEICLNCWTRIAESNEMQVNAQKIGEDTLFSITDEKSQIMGTNYMFILALKLK